MSPISHRAKYGVGVAQMVEYALSMRGARGSIPLTYTALLYALSMRGARGIDTPHLHCSFVLFIYNRIRLKRLPGKVLGGGIPEYLD